jgi:hypothetical protein
MDAKQALTDRLKEANNILVTVSNNPSVDQLASCIGLTLALNKMNKHATAVFSGAVPSTIEFLQPEKTIEKNTDSLRDFIISLDKAKADKLRYKVEDTVVKIFITPYKTSISDKDLEFSQGDFNVDAVVAIGVHAQGDLDQAITSHGRILHDATVTTINVKPGGELGTINWLEPKASSLAELVAELVIDGLGKELLDEQMSTALLTGIVAETERFSNDKTIPATMTLSAELMAAGANQQLVATKLAPKPAPPPPPPTPLREPEAPKQIAQSQPADAPIKATAPEPPKVDDGTLEISHNTDVSSLESKEEPEEPELAQIHIDDQGSLRNIRDDVPAPAPAPAPVAPTGNTDPTKHMEPQHMIMEPPSMGGQLTASVVPEEEEEKPAGDPTGAPVPGASGLLQRATPFPTPAAAAPLPPIGNAPEPNPYPSPFEAASAAPAPAPLTIPPLPSQPTVVAPTPAPAPLPPAPVLAPQPAPAGQTLSDIEQNVHSPHIDPPAVTEPGVEPDLVLPTAQSGPAPITGVDVDSARNAVMQAIAASPGQAPAPIQALNAQPFGAPLHDGMQAPQPPVTDPNAPPPGPPPMIPPVQPS